VRTLLFRAATRADSLPMPAAVYCEPEVAQVGLTLAQAQALHGAKAKAVAWRFEENDRAQAERSAEGLVKLVIGPGGAILGGAGAGEGAGDMIGIVGFCMANKLKVRALTNWIAPYPTRIEALKRAAGAVYTPVLFSPRTRRLVSLLWKLP
jgi:pyruvate/2-oxoglutarate dehydrogenase complex dihydrolipoamide dehydrogenase (E3) component